jgi:hypothetical protein
LHPTSPQAKLICSIFIYFGVACIGLLLGSLLASSLDDESRRAAQEQLADNCLNCQRLGLIHDHKHTHTGGIPQHFGPQNNTSSTAGKGGGGLSGRCIHESLRHNGSGIRPSTLGSRAEGAGPIKFGNKSFFSERFNFSAREMFSSLRGGRGPLFRQGAAASKEKEKEDAEKRRASPFQKSSIENKGEDDGSPKSSGSTTTPTAASISNGLPTTVRPFEDETGDNINKSGEDNYVDGYFNRDKTSSGDDEEDTDSQQQYYDEETPMLSAPASTSSNMRMAPHFNPSPVSPRVTQIKNQSHTRHFSIDAQYHSLGAPAHPLYAGRLMPSSSRGASGPVYAHSSRGRNFSYDVGSRAPHREVPVPHSNTFPGNSSGSVEHVPSSLQRSGLGFGWGSAEAADDEPPSSSASEDSWENPLKPLDSLAAARHTFLTLKQAVMNSLLIILVGSLGFYYIENLSPVDSFYFTTVLLTTVGYGDIVPVTNEGKVFATIYVLVAGTILLHNMSLISMIPLELRKRRIEKAVLSQFGDHLDDAALRELATGPLTQRLQIAANRADGLNECTREMFSLAMLVRLGRISERDVKATFNAFRRLDRDNDGKLSSKDIICGMFDKMQSRKRKDSRNVNGNAHVNMNMSYGPPEEAAYLPSPPPYNRTNVGGDFVGAVGGPPPVQPQYYPNDMGLDMHDANDFIQETCGPQGPLLAGNMASSYGSHQNNSVNMIAGRHQHTHPRHGSMSSMNMGTNMAHGYAAAPPITRTGSQESSDGRSHRSYHSEVFASPGGGAPYSNNRGMGIAFSPGAGMQAHSLSTRHVPMTTAGYGTYDHHITSTNGGGGEYGDTNNLDQHDDYFEQNLNGPEIYGSHPSHYEDHGHNHNLNAAASLENSDADYETQYVSPNSVSNL